MKKTYTILLFLIVAFCPVISRASHAQGADLTYHFVDYTFATDVSRYYVTLTFYRDCGGIPSPTTMPLEITNSFCGGSYDTVVFLSLINGLPCPLGGVSGANGCEVSHLCTNALPLSNCSGNNTYPGMQKYVYSDTISLARTGIPQNRCNQWTLSVSISARNYSNNLVNAGGNNLYIEATINNTIDQTTLLPYVNSSPIFQNDPVPFACISNNIPVQYNNGGLDADGDSLVYSLVAPLQAHNSPVAYNAGYSISDPITSATPCVFNGVNGILTYEPTQTEVDGLAFLVQEYRSGVLIGSTRRDVQIKVLNCNETPPYIGLPAVIQGGVAVDTAMITGCPGDHMIVDVPVNSPSGANIDLQSSIDQFPASFGMTFTQIGTGYNVIGRVEWQPIDTVCRYVYIKATSEDCPVTSSVFRVIKICGNNRVSIAPHSAVYCGQPITLTASGGINPVWTPSVGISSVHTLATQVSPASSTWYHFASACASDSVYVRVTRPIVTGITHDTTLCNGFAIQLQEMVTTPGSYSYLWVPSLGLTDPSSGVLSNTISNPILKTNLSTVYHCYVTDTSGCALDDSVRVTVHGAGALILTGDTLVSVGAQANFAASLSPSVALSNTISDTSVVEVNQVQVGTSASLQGGNGFVYPSPFGNYYKSARHQMLFKASELSALFGGARVISSLSLDIGTLNSGTALHNFTLKIGSTRADSLTQYEGGNSLLTVFEDTAYTPVAGWNTMAFQNAYIWDGISDLVVDICFTNSTNGSICNKMRYTPTPFRSYWFTYGNGFSMCDVSGSQAVAPTYASFFQRPDAKFGLGVITGGLSNLVWSPATGINAVHIASGAHTYANVLTDQWYKVTLADSVCPQADSVFVHLLPHGNHTPLDTAICLGDTLLMIAYNASTYSWSDNTGVLSTDSFFYYAPGQSSNVVLTMNGTWGTSIDTSHIAVLDQIVWPGDVNADHTVDNNDILYIGIAFGNGGAVRPHASQAWTGQCAPTWDSTFATGTNYAHADCDGDGVIGYNDTLAVSTNWGLTHAKNSANRTSNYDITITTDKAFYHLHDTIIATLSVGDNNTPVPNIYGIAYQFTYSSAGSARIIGIDQSVSWLDRKLDFKKVIQPSTAYLAQSRIDHIDTTGYGRIAVIKLVANSALSLSDSAYLSVGSILALDKRGDTVVINPSTKIVVVSSAALSIDAMTEEQSIDIYPNPNNGSFAVTQSAAGRVTMSMTDAIGREVYERTITDKVTSIDLSKLPDGIYVVRFSSAAGQSSKRIVIAR